MIPRRLAHLLLFLCAAGLPGCAASGPDAVMLSSGRVPASYEHGLIYLEMRVNGRPGVLFLLDTGASLFETDDIYLNIPQRDWARLRAANPSLEPERHFTGSGVGGEVRLPVARIEGLAIGPIRREHAYVIVQPQQGYFARPDAVGFVSNNLLEKFGPVTIDYPRRTLLLAAP